MNTEIKSAEEILSRFIIEFPESDNMCDEAIKRNVYKAMEAYHNQFKSEPIDLVEEKRLSYNKGIRDAANFKSEPIKSNEGNVWVEEISQIYRDCWEDGDEIDYDAEGHAHYYESKNYERTFDYEVFGKQMEEFYLANIMKDENHIIPIKSNEGNVWVLCPKCNGQGTVSKPPYIAGDVHKWSSTSAQFVCDVCNGSKVLSNQYTPIKSTDVGDDKWFKKLKQLWNLLNPKNICRDCADENGTCPTTNLPCDPQEAAIQTILKQKSIDVGDVEKAAQDAWDAQNKYDDIYPDQYYSPPYKDGFKACAEWRKKSNTTDVGEQEDAYVIQLEDALVGLVGWFDKYKEMLDKVFKLSDDDTKMQVPKAVTEAKRVLDLKR